MRAKICVSAVSLEEEIRDKGSSLCDRQAERKHRPASQLAYHSDRSTVRFNNDLGDGQPHSGARSCISLVSATIELFKNKCLLERINARATIGNASDEL